MQIEKVVKVLTQERNIASRRVEQIDAALAALNGTVAKVGRARRQISPEGLAKIKAAQRARWAKYKRKNRSK